MSGALSGRAEAAAADREAELSKLHAKIGEPDLEREPVLKASGR
tara:strand:- start:488 stop:619 length:132 start_codon:yes stop_codon:yes gene_type:complete